jgi:mRNA-degrading endonuclease RelE of RelBE toxin-antitoxin system
MTISESSRGWRLSFKPRFLTQLNRLPASEAQRITKRAEALAKDPLPDGHQKKVLKGYKDVLRARAGNLRLLYKLGDGWVTLLKVEHRSSVYDTSVDNEALEPPEVEDYVEAPKPAIPDWHQYLVPNPPKLPEPDPLPEPITVELLTEMRIAEEFHPALLAVTNHGQLLEIAEVPEDILIALDERLLGRPLEEALAEPQEYELQDPIDLLRYHQGNLVDFLLRLSPEQAKFVDFHLDGVGPTLLEGGPGSGKSVVALHRVRAAIQKLQAEGLSSPKVLFTTYTTTLCAATRQLLATMGAGITDFLQVVTVDQLVHEVAGDLSRQRTFLDLSELTSWIREMIPSLEFEGNRIIQGMRRRSLERLEPRYLAEELTGVLQARRLRTLEAYLETPRRQRSIDLGDGPRRGVFTLLQAVEARCAREGRITWSGWRAAAADRVEAEPSKFCRFDAVIVDEAQDLEPAALAVVAGHAVSAAALFLAADPAQSIYGTGFDWRHVHRRL